MIEKQYLSDDEYTEYRKLITLAVFDTYTHSTRSYSFTNLPERVDRSRCLNCGQSFLYVKDKRKYRYCSPECNQEFKFIYGLFEKQDYLMDNQNKCCAICRESLFIIKDRNKTVIKEECLSNDDCFNEKGWRIKKGHNCWKNIIEQYEVLEYDIDHIQELVRFKDNNFLQAKMYFDPNNLQLLCKPCHKKKTANFLREWLSKPKPAKTKSKALMSFIGVET